MKKIIIITDAWDPQFNGVATSLKRITKILSAQGYDIKIIHHGMFYSFQLPLFPEVRVAFWPGSRIKKILTKEKPDYIHLATEGQLGLVTRIICVKRKIKFSTAYHTNYDLYIKARVSRVLFGTTRAYLRWFHNAAAAVMVSTESLKKKLAKNGFRNLVVCPQGVDAEFFKQPEKKINVAYLRPIFSYVGRIAKEKNIDEYLACDLPGTKLVIGDGPQKKQLERKYASKAVFLGYRKGQELVDLLSQSDVFVFPSLTDTFGLVVLEALATGVPVAAHNVMGPRDIITHNVDGFLGDDLALAARECLKLNRENCRKKALLFSWEHSAEMFLKNLQKC